MQQTKTKLTYLIELAMLVGILLVMNLIFVFFGESYGAAKGIAADAVYP